jgi:hypothetical protein
MKTKDFIKMLQEEDPTGEGYIRLPDGGAPWFAESKPGYWDGSYQYLEKMHEDDVHNADKRIVTSTEGYKIDIHVLTHESIIWDENGDMDKIRERIKVNFTYVEDKHEKEFWKSIEEDAKHAKEYDDEFLYKRGYNDVLDNFYYDSSWEVRQPLDKPIGYYHCMKAFSFFKIPIQLNQGQCDVIIRSGKFYPEKKKKYYVWRHDPEKGQVWKIK